MKVLEADGSIFAACVNGASLALVDAGVAMKDIVCSCSVADLGYASGEGSEPVIDVNKLEQMSNLLTLTCLPRLNKIVKLEFSRVLHGDRLHEVLTAALAACSQVHSILDTSIQDHIKTLASGIELSG